MSDGSPIVCACEREELRGFAPVGNTSDAAAVRHKYCYLLAYNYVASRSGDNVTLVHGKIIGRGDDGELADVDHAWVVEADGWVWEPTNDAWFHDEDAFRASQLVGRPIERWEASEASDLYEAHQPIGRWDPHVAENSLEDGDAASPS